MRLKRRSHQDPYENARIVVIQDTLGEAKDLLRLLAVEEANIQYYETTHRYAITTAKLIAPYEKEIKRREAEARAEAREARESRSLIYSGPNYEPLTYSDTTEKPSGRRLFNRDPYNRAADPIRHELVAYGTRQRQKYQRLVDYWKALDQRLQANEVTRLALQGAEAKKCEHCLGFAASQLVAYLDGVRLNALAPEAVKDMLALEKPEDNSEVNGNAVSEFGALIGRMVRFAAEIIDNTSDAMVKEVIHQLFFEIHIETALSMMDGRVSSR